MENFPLQLVLSSLSGKPLVFEKESGFEDHEVSLIRLVETISNGCEVQINQTNTKLCYKPGVLVGGNGITYDCGTRVSISYFLQPLLVLALFCEQEVSSMTLSCVVDPTDVFIFEHVTLVMLHPFGVNICILPMSQNGNLVVVNFPHAVDSLKAVKVMERFPENVFGMHVNHPNHTDAIQQAALGVLSRHGMSFRKIPCFISHDGGGLSIVAKHYYNVFVLSSQATGNDPNELAERAGGDLARELLGQEGVVDSKHKLLLLLLTALCPEGASCVRVGPLSEEDRRALQDMETFLGARFFLEPKNKSVMVKCLGGLCPILGKNKCK